MWPVLRLNTQEEKLRRLLLDVSRSINDSKLTTQPVIIRWAGGWVRDKLLGIESHDIDVAINAMTGVDFAQRMCDFCSTEEAIEIHAIKPDGIGNLHNIYRNPDKSKHLETAVVRIFGLDLDLVNLRKETYAEDSRNPTVEFGTPEEDALRRDATINALFYNIHTGQIEDFTGGMHDLTAKVLRTPLNPLETFKDDPLRVLRLVRFASRLGFTIEEKARKVMAHAEVLQALQVKISRERVGTELEKMLKGNNPRSSLELIDQLCLYHAVFTGPLAKLTTKPDTSRWYAAYECLNGLMLNPSPGSLGKLLIRSTEAKYVAWNLAALSPWMNVKMQSDGVRKANTLPPPAVAAREGLKAPNKLLDVITCSYRNRQEIMRMKSLTRIEKPTVLARDTLGMAIRKWDSHGGQWTLQVLSALLVEAMEEPDTWSEHGNHKEKDGFINGWQIFLDQIIELDVYDAPAIKRLLDGRSLALALGVKPGKWTGKALDICLAWQLRHPQETDPKGAVDEIKLRRDELGIPR
ncbi:Poly A polymerase, head domain protein [Metarhizium rileyi]|uniref:CCA tRNA nucleotidyltransferase, mitochondrial n=1 Tax=Metarhizium rileyi (strain RCEF 4871) TaxID=1649241 RepID=A0A167G7W6_METRR|nr:Poly A polymerase, head domain protein [Metarhizium rileyi RCEF 4871]TWU78930.1 CCA tRNA nucleotidyltransferase, mitochondrial [Metarhizium rileyi]